MCNFVDVNKMLYNGFFPDRMSGFCVYNSNFKKCLL
nr:MAG TPA: hypothetical protein [Caudoviricetes sp.]